MIKVYILSVVLFFNIRSLKACNGYNLKLNTVKNCIDNSVIQIPPSGFNVVLDNDCNIIVSGCIDVTKPLKTAKGTYHIKKAPLPPLEGELDFCEALNEYDVPMLKQALTNVGMPVKCPVPAKKACGSPNKKINIAAVKNQLGFAAGTTEVKLEVEHDSGKTCAEFSFTLSKPKKG